MAWEDLEKKGYIKPRRGPIKAKPLPKKEIVKRTKPAPGKKPPKAGLPDNKAAPEKAYQPGIWAHNIAASMGFTDMPPEVEQEFAKLLTTGEDATAAQQKALAYLRGTDWHKQKYVGFASGVQNGLWGTEGDYNAWKSQVTDVYRQYYGRPPSSAELLTFAQSGWGAGTVHQIGEGHAWAQANAPDIQYAAGAFGGGRLSPGQLETLGQQYSGRSSAVGSGLQTQVEQAIKRMQRVFEGVLASPNLSLGSGGLSAPSLNPKQNPDVGR